MEHSRQSSRQQDRSRQQARDRSQKQSPPHEQALTPQAALQALLAGADLAQLPAQTLWQLSGMLGNSALLALLARPAAGPKLAPAAVPAGADTPPLDCAPPAPQLAAAPGFGALGWPAEGAPLAL